MLEGLPRDDETNVPGSDGSELDRLANEGEATPPASGGDSSSSATGKDGEKKLPSVVGNLTPEAAFGLAQAQEKADAAFARRAIEARENHSRQWPSGGKKEIVPVGDHRIHASRELGRPVSKGKGKIIQAKMIVESDETAGNRRGEDPKKLQEQALANAQRGLGAEALKKIEPGKPIPPEVLVQLLVALGVNVTLIDGQICASGAGVRAPDSNVGTSKKDKGPGVPPIDPKDIARIEGELASAKSLYFNAKSAEAKFRREAEKLRGTKDGALAQRLYMEAQERTIHTRVAYAACQQAQARLNMQQRKAGYLANGTFRPGEITPDMEVEMMAEELRKLHAKDWQEMRAVQIEGRDRKFLERMGDKWNNLSPGKKWAVRLGVAAVGFATVFLTGGSIFGLTGTALAVTKGAAFGGFWGGLEATGRWSRKREAKVEQYLDLGNMNTQAAYQQWAQANPVMCADLERQMEEAGLTVEQRHEGRRRAVTAINAGVGAAIGGAIGYFSQEIIHWVQDHTHGVQEWVSNWWHGGGHGGEATHVISGNPNPEGMPQGTGDALVAPPTPEAATPTQDWFAEANYDNPDLPSSIQDPLSSLDSVKREIGDMVLKHGGAGYSDGVRVPSPILDVLFEKSAGGAGGDHLSGWEHVRNVLKGHQTDLHEMTEIQQQIFKGKIGRNAGINAIKAIMKRIGL